MYSKKKINTSKKYSSKNGYKNSHSRRIRKPKRKNTRKSKRKNTRKSKRKNTRKNTGGSSKCNKKNYDTCTEILIPKHDSIIKLGDATKDGSERTFYLDTSTPNQKLIYCSCSTFKSSSKIRSLEIIGWKRVPSETNSLVLDVLSCEKYDKWTLGSGTQCLNQKSITLSDIVDIDDWITELEKHFKLGNLYKPIEKSVAIEQLIDESKAFVTENAKAKEEAKAEAKTKAKAEAKAEAEEEEEEAKAKEEEEAKAKEDVVIGKKVLFNSDELTELIRQKEPSKWYKKLVPSILTR